MDFAISSFQVHKDVGLKRAMEQLEETEKRVLFVIDDHNKLYGSLTDGDIRRWLLAGGGLDEPVAAACNRKPHVVGRPYAYDQIKQMMLDEHINCVPVVNARRELIELLFWERVFKDEVSPNVLRPIDLPVVIMAGGKGTRLDPFTRVLPKPLIPVGDKTIIERIIDSFTNHGARHFHISVNHKAGIIKSYFEELAPSYSISYLHEDKPLGTAGSLKQLSGQLSGPFVVTNCDIIVRTDYADLIEYHRKSHNDVTLVASLKHYHIPYGICEIENGGNLLKVTEKPEYSFLVNTGMYVLEPKVLALIPANEMFHMTQLLERVQASGGKVGVYPISEKSWLDTGEWAEYKNALQQLEV